MGPLIPNTGLFHIVSSTFQSLTIAFTADRQKMEDPDFYAQCLRESFDDLYKKVFSNTENTATLPESEKVAPRKKTSKMTKKT
jgi:hypothetical protein